MPTSARLAHDADTGAIWSRFSQYTPLAEPLLHEHRKLVCAVRAEADVQLHDDVSVRMMLLAATGGHHVIRNAELDLATKGLAARHTHVFLLEEDAEKGIAVAPHRVGAWILLGAVVLLLLAHLFLAGEIDSDLIQQARTALHHQ